MLAAVVLVALTRATLVNSMNPDGTFLNTTTPP